MHNNIFEQTTNASSRVIPRPLYQVVILYITAAVQFTILTSKIDFQDMLNVGKDCSPIEYKSCKTADLLKIKNHILQFRVDRTNVFLFAVGLILQASRMGDEQYVHATKKETKMKLSRL
jgi:hypothetical protein